MRKLLLGVLGLVLVVLMLVMAAVFIPSPLQKWAVERVATIATGRPVTIGEPFRLRAWPPIEITASDIRVANVDWGTAPELARVASLDAKLDLLAYWHEGRVQVDRLVMAKPEANLEIGEDGRRNWDFGGGTASADGTKPDGPAPIPPFVLADVRVSDGAVAYDDRAAGTSKRAETITLSIEQTGPDQPVAIDGRLTFEGKPATLTGSLGRPHGAAAGERSPIRLSLEVPGATAAFDGEIETRGPAANGNLDVQLTASPDLLAWLGVAMSGGLPASATLQARIDLSASRAALSAMELHADQISASGDAAVDFTQTPRLTGDIALARLDLSPYLASKGRPGTHATETDNVASTGWPDTPINNPLPLPVDADVRVRGAGVKAGKIEIGAFVARLQAKRQQAAVIIDQLQAFGGGLKGMLKAEASTIPSYAVDIDANGISVLAASDAIAGLHRIDGRAAARAVLKTRGGNIRELVGALAGDGGFTIKDGAVLGINIAGMLRQIMTLGLDSSAGEQQRTDFAEAGANFRIVNGILRTQDLRLSAPVLRLQGEGAVDLPERTIDMRITPRLATTLQGQGASDEPVLQAGIPFVIQGPYASPSVRFDLNGTLTSAIQNPRDVANLAADLAKRPEALKVLKDQFDLLDKLPAPAAGELIKGVLGERGGTDKGRKQQAPPDLGKAARGLLKGITGQ
jgi:AsmA protein